VKEHQVEAIGCATVAGFILFRYTSGFCLELYFYLFVMCLCGKWSGEAMVHEL